MDVVLQSNESSPLLTALYQSKTYDLAYRLVNNYKNLSKNIVKISGTPSTVSSTDVANKSVTFQIPRFGLCTGLLLESTIGTAEATANQVWVTGDSTNRTHAPLGSSLFSRVDLQANNRTISTITDAYGRVRATEDNKNKYLNNVWKTDKVSLATTFDNSNQVVCYTPVYTSFFEHDLNFLDLRFITPLQLTCTFNTYENMGLAGPVNSAEVYLYVSYINLTEDDFNALEARNFNPDLPYSALSYSTFDEIQPVADGATTITINPSIQYATYASHLFLKDKYNKLLDIKSVTVNMGGRAIYTTFPQQCFLDQSTSDTFLDFDNVRTSMIPFSGSTTTPWANAGVLGFSDKFVLMSNSRNRVVSIFWGLHRDRYYNSGAVSLKNVPNFSITVTFNAAAASSSTRLTLVSEYWQMISVNAAGGSISAMASS